MKEKSALWFVKCLLEGIGKVVFVMPGSPGTSILAIDSVFHMGGKVTAQWKGDDGKQPFEASHEASRLFQNPRVHDCVSNWLKKQEMMEILSYLSA